MRRLIMMQYIISLDFLFLKILSYKISYNSVTFEVASKGTPPHSKFFSAKVYLSPFQKLKNCDAYLQMVIHSIP